MRAYGKSAERMALAAWGTKVEELRWDS
jgi:hypothetical protein